MSAVGQCRSQNAAGACCQAALVANVGLGSAVGEREVGASNHLDRVMHVGLIRGTVGHQARADALDGGNPMSDRHLVLAVYPDEATADRVGEGLMESDMGRDSPVGVLVLDEEGDLKAEKLGARSSHKGAAIGGVLSLLGPVGLGVGALLGGAAGALHHKNLGLSDADKERLSAELREGKAAVGIMAPAERASGIMSWLEELGGTPSVHELSDEALQAAEAETTKT